MRILVVEDDAEAATAMVRGLTEAGHAPTHAVDGAFGLLEAQKGGYDVYVVDRMMPRLDGIGMVETLRKDGDQTPVLFLSALGVWLAENIGTLTGTWLYDGQAQGEAVSLATLGSWYLFLCVALMVALLVIPGATQRVSLTHDDV